RWEVLPGSNGPDCRQWTGQAIPDRRARPGNLGRGPRPPAPTPPNHPRARRDWLHPAVGRAGRLHRAQRRRQVDHGQDSGRHPGSRRGSGRDPGPRTVEGPHRSRSQYRRSVRAAHQLWWDLPVIESFEMLQHIYAVPKEQFLRTRDELIELLQLAPLLDIPVRQLSLGQRMRCDLAASLLHAPPILFLDEPTIGLDAVSKLAVRDFIRTLNRDRGVTVVLTTHDMDDIEALCTRIIVIGGGVILSDGTLTELRNRVSRERWLTVDLEDGSADTVADPQATV